jgi:hypothetical protein
MVRKGGEVRWGCGCEGGSGEGGGGAAHAASGTFGLCACIKECIFTVQRKAVMSYLRGVGVSRDMSAAL